MVLFDRQRCQKVLMNAEHHQSLQTRLPATWIKNTNNSKCFIEFQEVLDHGDVKIMEEQLANAIESIVVSIKVFLSSMTFIYL